MIKTDSLNNNILMEGLNRDTSTAKMEWHFLNLIVRIIAGVEYLSV
jgi:hypothetical protein